MGSSDDSVSSVFEFLYPWGLVCVTYLQCVLSVSCYMWCGVSAGVGTEVHGASWPRSPHPCFLSKASFMGTMQSSCVMEDLAVTSPWWCVTMLTLSWWSSSFLSHVLDIKYSCNISAYWRYHCVLLSALELKNLFSWNVNRILYIENSTGETWSSGQLSIHTGTVFILHTSL